MFIELLLGLFTLLQSTWASAPPMATMWIFLQCLNSEPWYGLISLAGMTFLSISMTLPPNSFTLWWRMGTLRKRSSLTLNLFFLSITLFNVSMEFDFPVRSVLSTLMAEHKLHWSRGLGSFPTAASSRRSPRWTASIFAPTFEQIFYFPLL